MDKVFRKLIGVIFLAFAAVVISYTAYLTFTLAGRIVPGNVIIQAMTVALFDVGALVWFGVLSFGDSGDDDGDQNHERSIAQIVIAMSGFILSLIGVFVMVGAELILGQEMVLVDNPEQFGWMAIVAVIIMAIAHAFLAYAYKLASPEIWDKVDEAAQVAGVAGLMKKEANKQVHQKREEYGGAYREALVQKAGYRLNRMASTSRPVADDDQPTRAERARAAFQARQSANIPPRHSFAPPAAMATGDSAPAAYPAPEVLSRGNPRDMARPRMAQEPPTVIQEARVCEICGEPSQGRVHRECAMYEQRRSANPQ